MVAWLQGRCSPCGGGLALAAARSSRWRSSSSFTSGLLDRPAKALPLNAPSPSVPLTPMIISFAPLSLRLWLWRQRSLQQAGRLQLERDRNGLPLAGTSGVDFESRRMLAGFVAAAKYE